MEMVYPITINKAFNKEQIEEPGRLNDRLFP